MTLTTRQPLLPCGKPYASEQEALDSKRGRGGGFVPHHCEPGCGRWHLHRIPMGTRTAKPAARRETGPSQATRLAVLTRDGHACVCCGISVIGRLFDLQHRDARGMGGTSDPAANSAVNLITMLREHHQRVESRTDPEDHAKGYWLRMGEDPAQVPVMYFEPSGSGFTAWLLPDGSLSFDGPGQVAS